MAFDKLKEAMITVQVLALLDFNKEFIVKTDAWGRGLGVLLMQGRLVAYSSQALTSQGKSRLEYKRELMAIQKLRYYLLGRC